MRTDMITNDNSTRYSDHDIWLKAPSKHTTTTHHDETICLQLPA